MIDLIIDTDIGDDIDDALAIAFALRCPELRVLAVTTVFGHTAAKAKIAMCLLERAGCGHIPVFAGCGQPIRQPAGTDKLPCQYIPDEMDALQIADTHAVDQIIERVLRSERPVTLLSIGPLTNIAVALLREPLLRDRLERIVIMGGAYYFHYVEWNIFCDPEAADIVFRSGVPLTAVGLDSTKHCLMDASQFERLENAEEKPVNALLLQMIEQWRSDTGRTYPILHDALAVCALFDDGRLLEFEREAIEVELTGVTTRGLTFNLTDRDREEQLVEGARDSAARSHVEVVRSVHAGAFVDLFLDRLLRT